MFNKLLYIPGARKASSIVVSMFFVITLLVNYYFIDYFENATLTSVLLRSLIMVIIPAILLPGVIWISIRISLFKNWKNVLLHLLFSIVFVSVYIFLIQVIYILLEGYNIFEESIYFLTSIFRRLFLNYGSIAFLLYWGIVVLAGIQKYYKEVSELTERTNKLEAQLSKATLSTLKAQLKPHFLFNTLNMVDFLIHTDSEKAIDTISRLEDLIKSTFDQNHPNSCSIEAEIIFLKKYLDIEKSRFNDRLSINFNINSRTEEVKIPCYLIQPLVENSIKHGVGKSIEKCTITIISKFQDDTLVIEVVDNGNNVTNKPERSEWGVGLNNIEDRIKLFFGEGAVLDVGLAAGGGFISSIIIPKKYIGVHV